MLGRSFYRTSAITARGSGPSFLSEEEEPLIPVHNFQQSTCRGHGHGAVVQPLRKQAGVTLVVDTDDRHFGRGVQLSTCGPVAVNAPAAQILSERKRHASQVSSCTSPEVVCTVCRRVHMPAAFQIASRTAWHVLLGAGHEAHLRDAIMHAVHGLNV